MHHEQRERRGGVARLMNEVQAQAVEVGQEMWETVEPFFLLPPVEFVGPIPYQFLHVVRIDSASYFESGGGQDPLFDFKFGEREIGDGDRRNGELAPRG